MLEFKSQKIKAVIKDLLKKKGITYEELAEQLECSVPTIKRILGPEELTLNRLLQLCEIVNIDLAELEMLLTEGKDSEASFTPAQEAFLAKNKNHFAYLMKLLGGQSPKQIADKYGLNQRSTDKYLIALEKHELIRVTGKQKVKSAFKEIPSLGKGILSEVHFESFINNVAGFFIETVREGYRKSFQENEDQKERLIFAASVAKVTKASYDAFRTEQDRMMRDFSKLCDFEEKTKAPEELMTVVLTHASVLVNNDFEKLELLENTMGEIVNL